MYQHSSHKSTRPSLIAYRSGDLDAFLAAFVYWTLFGTVRGQAYLSVDLIDDSFEKNLTSPRWIEKVESLPDYDHIVSIGTGLVSASAYTRLFSLENNLTFKPPVVDEFSLHYRYQPKQSLLGNMLEWLEQDKFLSFNDSVFKKIRQFLNFGIVDGRLVVDQKVAEEISAIIPDLQPTDFPTLTEMLTLPMNPLASGKVREKTLNRIQFFREQFEQARMASTVVRLPIREVPELVVINSPLYSHPLAEKMLSDDERPVLVCQYRNGQAVGNIYSPREREVDVLSLLPSTIVRGNKNAAALSIPYTTLNALMASV